MLQNLTLNEAQQKAIEIYDRPLLILAGAGTGKTTTITARIANLILQGVVSPHNVLAVTFTNKAANEMKARIEKLVGVDETKGMWVGTFHGISARILRMYPKAIGLDDNFLIIDEADKKRLLTQIAKKLDIDEKRFPYKVLSFIVSQLKEKCISEDDEEKISTFKYKDLDIGLLYKTYQSNLRAMNVVDFDDLIFETVRLFKKEPQILKDLQNRFQFITVDEYQDTNELQYLWLKLIVGANPNICCVGDEDQSIYGWRGAKVEYILRFQEDFLGSQIIRLEDNYRSTKEILDAAMSVISNNKSRYDKKLTSCIHSNEKPTLFIMENDRYENLQMVQMIERHKENDGTKYRDNAVLVRATHQMRSIEDCFIKHKIPYKIIGGIKFYDRKEIKDLIAYLRFAYSLTDKISLERIINVPRRGIGDKVYGEIMNYIQTNNFNILDGMYRIASSGDLNKKTSQAIIAFVEFIKNINNLMKGLNNGDDMTVRKSELFSTSIMPIGNNDEDTHNRPSLQTGGYAKVDLSYILEKIYYESGYAQMLMDEKDVDSEVASKIENIRELIASVSQYNSIDEFLEHIALVSASDDDNNQDVVSVMTIHSAKGLEFKYVYLPAWEEGIFPSQKSVEENGAEGIEEERRLAYVALTRAKRNFYVFACKQRNMFGRLAVCQPSRFIEEMKQYLKIEDRTYYKQSVSRNRIGGDLRNVGSLQRNGIGCFRQNSIITASKTNKAKTAWWMKDNDGNIRQTNQYAIREEEEKNHRLSMGDRVENAKFGKGTIRGVYGKFYEVKFDAGETRVLNDIQKIEE